MGSDWEGDSDGEPVAQVVSYQKQLPSTSESL